MLDTPGDPKGAVGSDSGCLGGPLGSPWGAFGSHFGGLGVPLGAFGAQSTSKTVGFFHAPPLFSRFWCPKGAQEVVKLKLKSIKNRFKNRLNFLLGFGLVLDGFLVDFGDVFGTFDLESQTLLYNI